MRMFTKAAAAFIFSIINIFAVTPDNNCSRVVRKMSFSPGATGIVSQLRDYARWAQYYKVEVLSIPEADIWESNEQTDNEYFKTGQDLVNQYFEVRTGLKPLSKKFRSAQELEEATLLWYYQIALGKVRALSFRLNLFWVETQDVLQEFMAATSNAVKQYDPNLHKNFYSYLMKWFQSAEQSFVFNYLARAPLSASNAHNAASDGKRKEDTRGFESKEGVDHSLGFFIPDTSTSIEDLVTAKEVAEKLEQAFEATLKEMERTQYRFEKVKSAYYAIYELKFKPLIQRIAVGDFLGQMTSNVELEGILGKHRNTISALEMNLRRATILYMIEHYHDEIVSYTNPNAIFTLGRVENKLLQERAAARGLHFGDQGVRQQYSNSFKKWATSALKDLGERKIDQLRKELVGDQYRYMLDEVYLNDKEVRSLCTEFNYSKSGSAFVHKVFKQKLLRFLKKNNVEIPVGLSR